MLCIECAEEFDPRSPAKRRAGGLINTCPDCSEEPTTRYAGVAAGEGKMGSVQILSFQNEADRAAYLAFWQTNSGMHTGKSCQMMIQRRTPAVSFKTVAEFRGNTNHKGKA